MLRIASLVLAGSLVDTTPPAPTAQMNTKLALAPAESVESLHRAGEEHFDAGDYEEAREAWVGAYARVEPTEDTWPYRATLLSLIVTTTLAEFAADGDREPVREVADILDEALAADLDLEIRATLVGERERLTPYLDPPPSPSETPPPEDLEPIEPEDDTPKQVIPNPVWIGGGATLLAGGLAAIIAGSRFVPRAESQVQDAGDSTSMPPGSTFIDEERGKGTGWMAAGGVIAAAGAAALVIGIVRVVKAR